MKFGKNILEVNKHRLVKLDFRFDVTLSSWRPWPFHTEKCCHLLSGHTVSARRLCSSVCQFLIRNTFVIVLSPIK